MQENSSKNQANTKEQAILDAALKIFEQKGFHAATTSEIAKEAGVAEGTIFRYFKTKKDILRSILIKAIELLAPSMISKPIEILSNFQDKDEKEILKSIMKERVAFLTMHFPIIKTVFAEALVHNDIREAILDNIISKAKITFDHFFDNMVLIRKFRNIDKECAMRLLVGSFITLILYQHMFNKKFTEEELDQSIDSTLDILLNGLLTNNSKGSETI